MKKMILEIEVDDDFENGDCDNCPLGYENEYYVDICPLNNNAVNFIECTLTEFIDKDSLDVLLP